MDKRKDSYCLVLGGGGAKGVYHIGVWRALREMGIEVDAFVGASIGAIVAGFMAQGSDEALEEIGATIGVDSILGLPEELTENGEIKLDRDSLGAARELFRKTMAQKGLDTSPLRRILSTRLDEDAIRESGRDLGIVTINLTDLEPREVFVEEMERGRLVDYLMASSAFPGFESPVIAGKKYVDGGMYDNVPYEMARKRGYRRIIVSDISGAGRNRRPRTEGTSTTYIKNSIEMGGVLDFDRAFLDAFNRLGYLDAKRSFGRLLGYGYFVEPGPAPVISLPGAPPPFPERMRHDRDLALKLLECAAAILGVERVEAYSYASLAAAIDEKREAEDGRIEETLAVKEEGLHGQVARLREAIMEGRLEGCPYYYHRLVERLLPKTAGELMEKALARLRPELPAGLAYLESRTAPVPE